MTTADPKETLHRYLQVQRDALVWKLDGLSEYDVRRPMTPTGTNLLGLVKHLATLESGYFGDTFGRPMPDRPDWFDLDDEASNADMWATAEQSRAEIVDTYRRACAHGDATIEALPLDAPGRVPWWASERAAVTLQHILVHMLDETARHAGHADIVRELIDGQAGLRADNDNLWQADGTTWQQHRDRLQRVAENFR